MLECVVNVSEGRSEQILSSLAAAAGDELLDVHADPHHHRSVFTLVGVEAVRRLTVEAVATLDLRGHDGVHPRIGVVDVVPFVPLFDTAMADAVAARDDFCAWAGAELGLPCFAYGPGGPTLPELRRRAFVDLAPVAGPSAPHPSAGAVAVGARDLLVAYNLWLDDGADLAAAKAAATAVRGDGIRALGLAVGERVQVSMNLIDPLRVGPGAAWDRVAATGAAIAGAELVGLVPDAVLQAEPPGRWSTLDLSPDRTIEARLRLRGTGGQPAAD